MNWMQNLSRIIKEKYRKIKKVKITKKIKLSILLSAIFAVLTARKIFRARIAAHPLGKEAKALPQIHKIAESSLSAFYSALANKNIARVKILPSYIQYTDIYDDISRAFIPRHAQKFLEENLLKSKVEYAYQNFIPTNNNSYSSIFLFFYVAIWGLAGYLIYRLFSNMNQSELKTSDKPQKLVTFADVVGAEDCKLALKEVIEYMRQPSKFQQLGARMRRGIIFYGPSGTGKTTLAKATAGEAKVPFYSCNASQFCEIYVGVGPKRVKELFRKAKQNSPSIIYIDQIDAIGNRKNSGSFSDGSCTQRNSTINQLLSEMDGFSSQQKVLVIASTNRLEMIDSSLLRPGRFDIKIRVPLPNQHDRLQILQFHLSKKNHQFTREYLESVVAGLHEWSGADLQNLANQAVYTSLRMGERQITRPALEQTIKKLNYIH